MKTNQVTNLQVSKALKRAALYLGVRADARNKWANGCCEAIADLKLGFGIRPKCQRYLERLFMASARRLNGFHGAYWYSAKTIGKEDRRLSRTIGLLLASELAKEGLFCKRLGIKVVEKKKRPSRLALEGAKVLRLAAEMIADHPMGACTAIAEAKMVLKSYLSIRHVFRYLYYADAERYNGDYQSFWYGDRFDRECQEARIMGLLLAAELLKDGQFENLLDQST